MQTLSEKISEYAQKTISNKSDAQLTLNQYQELLMHGWILPFQTLISLESNLMKDSLVLEKVDVYGLIYALYDPIGMLDSCISAIENSYIENNYYSMYLDILELESKLEMHQFMYSDIENEVLKFIDFTDIDLLDAATIIARAIIDVDSKKEPYTKVGCIKALLSLYAKSMFN